MRLMGFILGLGFLLWGCILGGELGFFFDSPTLLIVFGGGLAFTYAAHGCSLWRACGQGFLDKNDNKYVHA